MGNWVQECDMILMGIREETNEDLPYLVVLGVETLLFVKESLKFGFSTKKINV